MASSRSSVMLDNNREKGRPLNPPQPGDLVSQELCSLTFTPRSELREKWISSCLPFFAKPCVQRCSRMPLVFVKIFVYEIKSLVIEELVLIFRPRLSSHVDPQIRVKYTERMSMFL